MPQDVTSPLIPASNSQIKLPGLVAPATLQQAAMMNPMQAMLGQYGLSIPSPQQIPEHFMFSDQQAPAGFPQTGQYGAGFGAMHPALATGIENALLGAQMAPGGAPTAGQNIAQVAGSLTGVPQWRLQRRIGMTLAPLEIAGSMQNILSQQAQAQGQLLTGQGELARGYGYQMMGQGRQMEALANMNRVSTLVDLWNRNPTEARKYMDATGEMGLETKDPMYWLFKNGKPGDAEDYAKLLQTVHTKYGVNFGHMTTPEWAFNVLQQATAKNDKRTVNNVLNALKLTAPFYSAMARSQLLGVAGQVVDPMTGFVKPTSPQQLEQYQQDYFNNTPMLGFGMTNPKASPKQGQQLPDETNPEQPFGDLSIGR